MTARIDLTADQLTQARALLDDGAPYSEVAATLGLQRTTVAARFPGYGWTKAQVGSYRRLRDRHRDLVAAIDAVELS